MGGEGVAYCKSQDFEQFPQIFHHTIFKLLDHGQSLASRAYVMFHCHLNSHVKRQKWARFVSP